MAISWTKAWSSSDDGTIVSGGDLKNIQDDIEASQGDSTALVGVDVDTLGAGDDGYVLYYDLGNSVLDWKEVVDVTGNQTVAGVKTFSSFPVTPSSAPTTDYQVANKKYVDDNTVTKNREVFTSSGTWTRPAGVTSVFVKVWGAGGGGTGLNGTSGAQGGAGGGYAEGDIAVSGNVTVTVGAGGTKAAQAASGGTGGTSSFAGDTTIQATGGEGGQTDDASGGVGSGGDLNLTAHTVFYKIGDEIQRMGGSAAGGGGVGTFDSTVDGGGGTAATGAVPGAGGSATTVDAADAFGGVGGAGLIIVEWFE